MKAKVIAALQFVGLFAFIAIFLSRRELVFQTWEEIKEANWIYLFLSSLMMTFSILVSSYRLKYLIDHAKDIHKKEHLKVYFLNSLFVTFFNLSLVSGAGDLYRLKLLFKMGISKMKSGWILIFDRIIGMIGILLVAIAGSLFLQEKWIEFGVNKNFYYFVLICLFLFIGILLLLTLKKSFRSQLHHVFIVGKNDWPIVMSINMLSVLFWLVSMIFIFRSVGISELDFVTIVTVSSIVTLITILPISIGGLGVREVGFAAILAHFSIATDKAVAIGLIQYGCSYLAVILGAASLFRQKSHLH